MRSGEAHGWLIAGLINDHLRRFASGGTAFASDRCGPCAALRDYFNTPRGRAEAQSYLNCLSNEDAEWDWAPGGVIDWDEIERRMSL